MSDGLPPPSCAAVWGAAGFIGRHAADALLRRGWRVRGLARVQTDMHGDGDGRYEPWPLDFSASDAALAEALEGVGCAIHCAGHYDADEGELERYVGSVRRLAAVARDRGLNRLILISSIAVYGTDPGDPVTLATPPQPETPYARSRWRAEQAAQEVLAAGPTRLVVVRVPAVVSADMRSDVLRRFFRALHVGVFFHPGRADAVFPCIGVHRLAECLACAADPLGPEPPAVLQPVDCVPWVELAGRYGRATGRRLPRVGLPAGLVRWVCRTLGFDVGQALRALDSAVRYADNCAGLAGSRSLPDSADDIDALIASMRQQ